MNSYPVFQNLFILALAFILNACNGIGSANFNSGNISDGPYNDLVFSGITIINQKTDSTLRINWLSHPDAVSYQIYNVTSGMVYLGTVNAPATSYSMTGLTPNTTYIFLVRAKDITGYPDANNHTVSVTMNVAPDVPSALALVSPASSPDFTATPTVRVSGVKNGDTIKLFSDSSCTTQVATGVATGSTIDLTSSSLTAGSYTLYANASNSVPNASACSSASLTYEKLLCPPQYIPVPANPAVGANSDFCVMKFEAKCSGSTCGSAPNAPGATAVAVSQASDTPWVHIDQIHAKVACTNLGTGYDLISTPEWITIARNIETNAVNWNTGTVSSGALNAGHTDNSPASTLPVTDESDPYDGTGNNSGQALGSGWEQKRNHTLSNGEIIWDLSGNTSEWADWTLGGPLDGVTPANKAYKSADGHPVSANREFKALDMNVNNGDEMDPITWQATDPTLTSANNIGIYYGGLNNDGSGASLRGGNYSNVTDMGIFRFGLNNPSTYSSPTTGFRCVYRP